MAAPGDKAKAVTIDAPPQKKAKGPAWGGEAWARWDGMVLNLPIFAGCSQEFKRMLLREIRMFELEAQGKETWWDKINDVIYTLDTLDGDRLPPLRMETIGQVFDEGDYISRGGDYDTKLVLVLKGTVEKLVGDAPAGGLCVVRTLHRGDYEGIAEFLGVGSEQRTCALRAGAGGAHVRYVTKEAILKLLSQPVEEAVAAAERAKPKYLDEADDATREEPPDFPMKWPDEIAYFRELSLDRIDALPHKASKALLEWSLAGGEEPMDLLSFDQPIFRIDNALGTSLSGPLPEGIEERYFFNGQVVLRSGVPGDSLIMILRGEVAALVPEGCGGQCLPRKCTPDNEEDDSSWIGDGRDKQVRPEVEAAASERESKDELAKSRREKEPLRSTGSTATGRRHIVTEKERLAEQVAMVALVKPDKMKLAMRVLRQAEEAGNLDLSDQTNTDWRWSWDDPRAIEVIRLLKKYKLLSQVGEKKAEQVGLYQNPPQPPPPVQPQAVQRSGDMIGKLALLGLPVVFAGDVVARGPVLVVVLHRHVFLQALENFPEWNLFVPRGVSERDWVKYLIIPPRDPVKEQLERPSHLGPATGPPPRAPRDLIEAHKPPIAGTVKAWRESESIYHDMAAADAMTYAMLHALKHYHLFWELIHDAPPRLLEALVRQFEPRWVLPNEVIVVDEEPNAEFLFIVIHGDFIVSLEGAEIERAQQGAVQGAAQLLRLNDWTRTVTLNPKHQGEAMVQVLRRDRLVETLAGHPVPKSRLKDMEEELRFAKEADWRLLRKIPAFGSTDFKPFLARIHKDADVRLFCPGDFLAEVYSPLAYMIIVLAGTLRSEHPQTLFHVELHRGHWCFQHNILGNEPVCAHDVVATTHAMVLILHRHTLLNAIIAFPECREAVLDNETWRATSPQLSGLRSMEGVPAPVLARAMKEAGHRYFRPNAHILRPGEFVEPGSMIFIVRGEARVFILDIEVRTLKTGDSIGIHQFLKLPQTPPDSYEIVASAATDALVVHSGTLFEAMEEDRFEDDMKTFKNASSVLAGGEILDAFGLPVGGQEAKFVPDCVECSEVFRVCSLQFVQQLPLLVEDLAFWPGEKIYSQGDEGFFMYFVQAGRVRLEVLGRPKHQIVDGGATLGDMACLKQVSHYTETAIAETHVWVRALHRRLLERALASFPEEERRVMGTASSRREGVFHDD